MPRLSIVFASCALLCLGACPKTQDAPDSDAKSAKTEAGEGAAPKAPRLQATAPAPPDVGEVNLRFTGDFNHEVKAQGVSCLADAQPWINVSSAELEGADKPRWVFNVFGPPTPDGRQRMVLSVGPLASAKEYSDTIAGLRVRKAVDLAGPLKLQFTLSGKGEGKGQGDDAGPTVEVKGEIRCANAMAAPVDKAVLTYLKAVTGAEARQYATYDFGRAREPGAASVVLPEREARLALDKVRAGLGPGWVAFVGTTRWLGDEKHEGVELVVAPGKDQFDILRVARADAINYDMGTESLVRKFKAFDAQVGIDIVEASTDTVDVKLKKMPADLDAFAKEVYAFCPDAVDQGVGSLDALKADIQKRQAVFFWWD